MKQRDSLTGSIYYTKSTKRWRAAAYEYDLDDKRSLKTKQFKTKTEAKKWLEDHNELNKINERKRNGGHLQKKNVKISEFSQIWLERKKIQIKPRSYDRIESIVRTHIVSNFGDKYLSELSHSDIQEVLNQLAITRSKSTLKKFRETLNSMYKYAIALPEIDINKNPCELVVMPHEIYQKPVKEVEPLDYEAIQRFKKVSLSKFSNVEYAYRYGLFYLFMLNTGIRRGEALALLWKDIDFEEGLCHITKSVSYIKDRENETDYSFKRTVTTPKTYSSTRMVGLSDETLFYLSEYKKIQENFGVYAPDKPILTSKNGEPMSERNFTKSFYYILDRAGIERRGLHALRHTFASICFDQSFDIVRVSKLMGHSSPTVTQNIYIHMMKSKKQDWMQTLSI